MTRLEQQQQWKAVIEKFEESGQNLRLWCKKNGVKEHQMRYRMKNSKTDPSSKESQSAVTKTEPGNWLGVELLKSEQRHIQSVTVSTRDITIEIPERYDRDTLEHVLQILGVGYAASKC